MTTKVLLFQVDGKLPNLALMRLSTWHKSQGHEVIYSKSTRDLWFEDAELVYGSSIFKFSEAKRQALAEKFPNAITGGTGYRFVSLLSEVIKGVEPEELALDYSHYPQFIGSLGYSQRGCRLDCAFCRMKTREGGPRSVHTLREIWRGWPYPKHIHLLDNDFFGQSEWADRLQEAIEEGFRVCFNQGINIRLINEAQATLLAKAGYWDDSFTQKRLYTAWDNLGDERFFKAGVETMKRGGIRPEHLMVYMLIGFKGGPDDPNKLNPPETEEEIFYRFNEMVAMGCRPYPMVYDRTKKMLTDFQRWVIRRYYEFIPWSDYKKELAAQRNVELPLWDAPESQREETV